MGGKPKGGTKPDRRLAENRSSAYKAGDRTKGAGKPTNARDGASKARVEKPQAGKPKS
jgi:hypothetical protein